MFRKLASVAVLGAALFLGTVGRASATLVTFAQFTENASSPSNPFTYQNLGNGYTLYTATIPVNFIYLANNGVTAWTGAPLGVPIASTLTMSAVASAPAQSLAGGLIYSETFQNISMQFTANTPVGPYGGTNLLTLGSNASNGVTGTFLGTSGGTSPVMTGSTTSGNNVSFSSDFLDFKTVVNEDFSLSFSSLTPNGLGIGGDGYFNPFTASGVGTFSSDPAPLPTLPEPGVVAFAVSMGASGLYGLRRKLKTR
jgi:hypothetical protein